MIVLQSRSTEGAIRRLARHRGLTLFEMLATLALIFLVLGLAGDLFTEYSRTVSFSEAKEATFAAAQTALDRMRLEYCEAIQMVRPPAGSTANFSELRFFKAHPDDSLRLPAALPLPLPANWTPFPERVEVAYRIQADHLLREVRYAGSQRTQTLARGLNGFSCQNLGEGELLLTLSVIEKFRIRTLQTRSLRLTP